MHCVRQVLAELSARSMGIALLHQGSSLGWVRVYLIKNNSITGRVVWVFQFISCLCLFLMEGENQWKCGTKEFSHTGLQWSHSKGFKPFPIAGSWFWDGLGVYFLWSFLEDLIHSWDAAMKSLCYVMFSSSLKMCAEIWEEMWVVWVSSGASLNELRLIQGTGLASSAQTSPYLMVMEQNPHSRADYSSWSELADECLASAVGSSFWCYFPVLVSCFPVPPWT